MCIYGPSFNYLLKGQYYTLKVTGFYCILKKFKQRNEQRKESLLIWLLLIMLTCYLCITVPFAWRSGEGKVIFLKVQREGELL